MLFLQVPPPSPEAALTSYVAARDRRYRVEKTQENGGLTVNFVSGTWHGTTWRHRILWRVPKGADPKTAILYVTGDGPRSGDYRDIDLLSTATGMPIAMLFDVPNQPIEGRKEDDLIAHSFAEFLRTGDPTRPALLPMTRAAIAAMDVVQSIAPVKRFVVTGASKRGWTTWLAGATGDRRIAGIAPMVFDNLNFARQLPRQLELWGQYSAQIEDYTRRGLQKELATPRGRALQAIVDPWTYRKRLTMPKLIVIGANDPYWATDAHSLYLDDLPGRTSLSITPNAGHDLGPKIPAISAIGGFARAIAENRSFPTIRTRTAFSGSGVAVRVDRPFETMRLWKAKSETTDFRGSEWKPLPASLKPGTLAFDLLLPRENSPVALFAEAVFSDGPRRFSLCTPISIVPAAR